jgi:hypothetical protein
MADAPVSPLRQQESATTREEVDFDDDGPEQETGTVSPIGHETPTKPTVRKSVSFQEPEEDGPPPSKPPRPLSPQQQAENTLIEAFPSIDTKVVKAVLTASGGKVEPAFNALLGMSDPSFAADEPPPPRQPARPMHREPMSQMEADEAYARRLAEQYNTEAPRAQNTYNQREPGRRGVNRQQQQYYDDPDSPERNFFDDDLPEIGRNIQQGFMETQKKFNSWITNLQKKIEGGDDEEEDLYSASQPSSRQNTGFQGRQNFGPSQADQLRGIRKMSEQRRSTEAQRYDADPHEMGEDEFERLELRDDEAPPPMPPRTSSRKAPNPDLFKSSPARQPPPGPVDEVDAADRAAAASGDEKSKKWQPLTSVAPAPEEDNDPFSLGDDDDADKTEDLRKEDTERLKEKARNSVSEGRSGSLVESETSGTKNKDAEVLLGGGKKE